jgi:hypothetical protein
VREGEPLGGGKGGELGLRVAVVSFGEVCGAQWPCGVQCVYSLTSIMCPGPC